MLYMPSWMSVLFNGMMSGLSVLFQTELRVQNKTDSEILACLSYSRVSKGPIWVSVLFHTSGPGICLPYSMVYRMSVLFWGPDVCLILSYYVVPFSLDAISQNLSKYLHGWVTSLALPK